MKNLWMLYSNTSCKIAYKENESCTYSFASYFPFLTGASIPLAQWWLCMVLIHSATNTDKPLTHVVISPPATCTGGAFSTSHWRKYCSCTQGNLYNYSSGMVTPYTIPWGNVYGGTISATWLYPPYRRMVKSERLCEWSSVLADRGYDPHGNV